MRYVVPVIFGVVGVAILLSLGVWQLRRMAWKEDMLTRIEQRISADPIPWADAIAMPDHEFVAVTARGRFTGEELHVLTSRKPQGPGYRVVAAFQTEEGPRILVDRGFIPADQKDAPRPPVAAEITGNLRHPQETDSFTPAPDREAKIWFARDAQAMAEELGTEDVFVILRSTTEDNPPVEPWPVDSAGIPDNHLQYAITWFLLAAVWAGMTVFLLWRMRRNTA